MDRIIGLDLGSTTLGIAISDGLGLAAHPYENYCFERGNYKKARKHILEICEKENIKDLCLGYPLHMSGDMSVRAQSALRFKDDLLKEKPNLNIIMVDERNSTQIATERLVELGVKAKRRDEIIDMMSAVVILESYLERNK